MQDEAGETGVNERRGMEEKVNNLVFLPVYVDYPVWYRLYIYKCFDTIGECSRLCTLEG